MSKGPLTYKKAPKGAAVYRRCHGCGKDFTDNGKDSPCPICEKAQWGQPYYLGDNANTFYLQEDYEFAEKNPQLLNHIPGYLSSNPSQTVHPSHHYTRVEDGRVQFFFIKPGEFSFSVSLNHFSARTQAKSILNAPVVDGKVEILMVNEYERITITVPAAEAKARAEALLFAADKAEKQISPAAEAKALDETLLLKTTLGEKQID